MKSKYLGLVFAIFMALTSMAQSIEYGKVLAVISLGGQSYCVINELGTERYYKTGLYSTGDLTQGQEVELVFDNNRIEVIESTLHAELYCTLIEQNGESDEWIQLLETMPILENEILFFEDTAHLHNFYESVGYFIEQSVDMSIDSVLDIIESQIDGFVSYRTWFNDEHDLLTGSFSVQQIEDIYTSDFINDEITKNILNEYREIGIGDSIHYFHGPNTILSIEKENSILLQTLRGIEDGEDILVQKYIEERDITWRTGGYYQSKGSYSLSYLVYYRSTLTATNIDCNVYTKKIKLLSEKCTRANTGLAWDCDMALLPGDWVINWGDGSSQTEILYQADNGDYITHTYLEVGTYVISTSYTFIDGSDTITLSDSVEVEVQNACTSSYNEAFGVPQISGDWMMISKLWVNNNFFGNHISSLTHSWKKNNDGSWSLSKSKIKATVDGDFRNVSCVYVENKNGSKEHNNDKKIQESKTKLFSNYQLGNGDVISTHRLEKGGVILTVTIVLNPC